jgi:hypothetical protein
MRFAAVALVALALWLHGIGSCVAALAMSTDVIYDVGDFYGILGKGLTTSQVFVETQVQRPCELRHQNQYDLTHSK